MATRAASELPLMVTEERRAPFHYFLAARCLSKSLELSLLNWLETAAPWQLKETDFYEQYEFSLLSVDLPDDVRALTSDAALGAARHRMEQIFSCALTERVELVAHKLIAGQRIAIHNDYLPGEETHRLTIQLNRGLQDDDGGFFMLFNSFDASDVHRIVRPVSNSGIGFEIGPASNHAVSRVHGGARYTLVYSFHAER